MILDALTVLVSSRGHRTLGGGAYGRVRLWHWSRTDPTSTTAQTDLSFMLTPLSLPISQTDAATLV